MISFVTGAGYKHFCLHLGNKKPPYESRVVSKKKNMFNNEIKQKPQVFHPLNHCKYKYFFLINKALAEFVINSKFSFENSKLVFFNVQ